MKQYCLYFYALSSISQIPDAQTIFGAICNILMQTQGEEALNKYISSFENEPILIHSSMFPENMLPMIHKSLFSIDYINHHLLQESINQQLLYLQKMKTYKRITYISQKVYTHYIQNNEIDNLQYDLIQDKVDVEQNCLKTKDEQFKNNVKIQLNTHVKKNGYYLTQENDLYYDTQLYTDKKSRFCIYIKTTLSLKQIKDIFQYSQYFGFGSRHSVGKNSFQLDEIVEKNFNSYTHMKLLLSKSFMDIDFDLSHSYYTISSRLHRTSRYYLENQMTGRFNLFTEGSYMHALNDKEWYGELIHQTVNQKDIYYYAIGYVL